MRTLSLIKKAAAPLLAAVMVLCAAVGPSASYFTTYVTAEGGYTLRLRDVRVIPHEEVDFNVKSITIQNIGRAGDPACYVRARVVSGSQVPVTLSGAGWSQAGDGYWYYSGVLQPGESTGVLRAEIALPEPQQTSPIPEGTTIDVVVLSECAKVLYDDAGAPKPNGPDYEGWSLTAKEGGR